MALESLELYWNYGSIIGYWIVAFILDVIIHTSNCLKAGWGTHIFCACGCFSKISYSNYLRSHFIFVFKLFALPLHYCDPHCIRLHIGDPQTTNATIGQVGDPHASFAWSQGEAPSQYYVPLAGFFVNKYLPSLQLQKHWICVFIFEINMRDPHTTSPANFHAYTIPKLEILYTARSKMFRNSSCIWPTYCIKSSKHFWIILY